MPSWQDAVQDAPGGTRILLDVSPGARHALFPAGFEPWRGRIGMRVAAPAEGGAANAEVVRALAAFFAHPLANVRLDAGATSRRKAARLVGLARAAALARLGPLLDAGPEQAT